MKTTLKTLLICLSFIISYGEMIAQYDKEIGITFNNFDDFDLLYKKQKGENKWSVLRGTNLSFGLSDTDGNTSYRFGLGFGIGLEYRKPIGEKLSFIHGPEFFTSILYQKSGGNYNMSLSPGFGYLLGFRYEFSDKFSLSIETRPSIRTNMSFGNNNRPDTFNLAAGFNSNTISLAFAYRFTPFKKK